MNKADDIFKRSSNGYEDFLLRVIGLNTKRKEILFQNIGLRKGMHFMNCLHNHYTDDEIMKLFYSIDIHESNIVQDTMKVFKSLSTTLIYHNFKKVNNNFSEIYDEFSRLKLMEDNWLDKNIERGFLYISANNVDYTPNGII